MKKSTRTALKHQKRLSLAQFKTTIATTGTAALLSQVLGDCHDHPLPRNKFTEADNHVSTNVDI